MKLQSPADLDSDAFVAEVKKLRGKKNPLSAAGLKSLREEHARTVEPLRTLVAEALGLEQEIAQAGQRGLRPDGRRSPLDVADGAAPHARAAAGMTDHSAPE